MQIKKSNNNEIGVSNGSEGSARVVVNCFSFVIFVPLNLFMLFLLSIYFIKKSINTNQKGKDKYFRLCRVRNGKEKLG
jgi:hypothetical protein